jgi:hypothetical protein
MPRLPYDLIEGRFKSEIREFDATHEVLLEFLKVPKHATRSYTNTSGRMIVEDSGNDKDLILKCGGRQMPFIECRI